MKQQIETLARSEHEASLSSTDNYTCTREKDKNLRSYVNFELRLVSETKIPDVYEIYSPYHLHNIQRTSLRPHIYFQIHKAYKNKSLSVLCDFIFCVNTLIRIDTLHNGGHLGTPPISWCYLHFPSMPWV